jgi:predicted esterase
MVAAAPAQDTERDTTTGPPPAAAGDGSIVELPVPDFGAAVVFVPPRRAAKWPLLIASHGAGDGPTWQCALWRTIVRERAFVLCPRGIAFTSSPDTGYFFRNHHDLEREVLAGIEALARAYPDQVDTAGAVYTGYSQGATMGALMVTAHAKLFPRLIMVEGGHSEWNVPIGKRYARAGGTRVLFACGARHCRQRAVRSAEHLNAAGLQARVEYAEGAGHVYGGAVAEDVVAAFEWVVAGDERWQVNDR